MTTPNELIIFSRMLRLVLFIFAVLGLVSSPAGAQAAQLDCGAMAGSTAKLSHAMIGKMDCCDKTAGKTEKSKSCASNCAAMGGIAASAELLAPYQGPARATSSVVFMTTATDAVPADIVHTDPPPQIKA